MSEANEESKHSETAIESTQHENRIFYPSAEFSASSDIKSFEEYQNIYNEAEKDPVLFWESVAENLHWFKKWHTGLEWNEPHAKWFVGGEINIAYNCLDRHLETWRKNKAAIIWEGEPEGETRTLTYQQLHSEVSKFANSLKTLGIKKGDRVAIYMPMVPEAAVAMLASARIGAIHSVVFGGFSPESLSDRINDSSCKALITADFGWRRGKELLLKAEADKALTNTPSIEHCIVLQRDPQHASVCEMQAGRDHWYHELIASASPQHEAEVMDAEDPLFILY
ncbi:MAG: AMP-binding protein, partial [Acidobacteria bacterium]|nr:AMP-binding protein [Acidobacteriota bacterium]